MTREEHLKFCKICKNKKNDLKEGIICGLNNQIADFVDTCESFEKDVETKSDEYFAKINLIDNSKRAKYAMNVFFGISILNLIAVLSGYFEFELLERIRDAEMFTEQEASVNDLRQGVIGILQTVLSITSIVLFLNWFRRAYGNLHRIGTNNLEHNETMAIWSFVIPIVSLFRPYKIAKEIAVEYGNRLSGINSNYKSSINFSIIGLWWTFFLIANYIGQFAFKSVLKDDTIEQMIASTQAYMISDFIDIPAALLTLLMIKQISKEETMLFENYNNGSN
ncbi:MAG: DUF4328 domain-containing protein [Bacteroidota bacterium]